MVARETFQRRRKEVAAALARDVLVLPAAPSVIRNNDVEHDYRQHSDLYFLTGFEEPQSALVLRGSELGGESAMFVRGRDSDKERWDGHRLGVDRAPEVLGVDAAYSASDIWKQMPELLSGAERLHYALGENSLFDDKIIALSATGLGEDSRRTRFASHHHGRRDSAPRVSPAEG